MDVAPSVGEILAEKYRVERVLGAGGMGVVVEATHLQLDQRVALKFMTSELRDNDSVLKRFAREARAAARLDGEHIARVFDYGELPDGAPYIVMEYLEGEDLSVVLDREGAQPVQRAVDLILQACVGVAEAHAAGIVHRDLKPANLFLARRKDGRTVLKVLDFGISKVTYGAKEVHLTQGDGTIGSPMYMSPEQIESVRSVDARTDTWSLGAVLYELLTGFPPFVDDSPAKVYVKVITEALTPLSQSRGDVPSGLEAAVATALAKDLDHRHPTVADFARALAPFGSKARAPALADSAVRIIAASPLAHDALPVIAATDPPPPVQLEPTPAESDPKAPVSGQATTVAYPDDEEEEPGNERASGTEPASLQKTSGASNWVNSEKPPPSRAPWLVIGAIAVVVVGWVGWQAGALGTPGSPNEEPTTASEPAVEQRLEGVGTATPEPEESAAPESEPPKSAEPATDAATEKVGANPPATDRVASTKPRNPPKASSKQAERSRDVIPIAKETPAPKTTATTEQPSPPSPPAASADPSSPKSGNERFFRHRE